MSGGEKRCVLYELSKKMARKRKVIYIRKCDCEPVCLGVLRELNARLSNRRNQNMFGWAKFVGLRF